ncbi:hypothetical protein SAMN05216464_10270 [Mucilaginibacter pineti]|uniref:Uncharacterized protein n=1 Tax=Mucilaginibacter pineti TaxID=1391627 RepID=A0A1G6W5Z2_9SPHI|nr:hypothetical protein [Mucilaginibacter pineti]SDD61360.1 hypothetical protein SAMN05216464_10270 [Mucilaginibacter pineti]
MNLSDYSFHDAAILKVTEYTANQTIEFLLDFPVNWEENLFEHRILRFKDVTSYNLKEIPFSGNITILDITGSKNKAELITNAGNRFIEFSTCELIKP